MKKMMLALVALFTMSVAAMAQNDNGQRRMDPKEMAKAQADRMADRYGLNDEQAAKVEALNVEFAGKLRPQGGPRRGGGQRPQGPRPEAGNGQHVDGQTGATAPNREEMEARRKEMQANQEAYREGLKAIMTEEQFAKYEEDMKRMQEQRGRRGGQRRGPRGE